ncbi:MAG TPA: nucleoside phosphorylase [Isosphaeraceae bacterium]|nr:nucleoside phosphorylase [Isosphaeraceae bacterium]
MDPRATGPRRSGERVEQIVAPAPVPADVGIVAALPLEVGDLVDRLGRVRTYQAASLSVIEGEHHDKVVAIVVGGVGCAAARRATELLLAGHRPSWIIAAGFAGALNPGIGRNELVLPDEVIDREGRRFRVEAVESLGAGVRHVRGRLLTVDRPILESRAKAELYQSFQADLVDMESSAVAAVCAERLVRFLGVRVISDEAQSDLPPEVATLLARSGSYRVGAALRAVWNRPSSLKDFWTLHQRAIEAADRLAKFLALCLDQLPG